MIAAMRNIACGIAISDRLVMELWITRLCNQLLIASAMDGIMLTLAAHEYFLWPRAHHLKIIAAIPTATCDNVPMANTTVSIKSQELYRLKVPYFRYSKTSRAAFPSAESGARKIVAINSPSVKLLCSSAILYSPIIIRYALYSE
jgi:hypothetical protein